MNNLRRARLQIDISQLELMKRSMVHYTVISKIERGWFKATEGQKKKLAEALEVDSNWLFPPEETSR